MLIGIIILKWGVTWKKRIDLFLIPDRQAKYSFALTRRSPVYMYLLPAKLCCFLPPHLILPTY